MAQGLSGQPIVPGKWETAPPRDPDSHDEEGDLPGGWWMAILFPVSIVSWIALIWWLI